MPKRFILFDDGQPKSAIDSVASDCAAVYALNGRFSSDAEIHDELEACGLNPATDADIAMVWSKFDQLIGASEAELEGSRLLSEDELIARVVRARDRQPTLPLVVECLDIDGNPLVPLVDPNKTEW